MAGWEGFSGINRGYVLELYERFRKDPSSVDPESRALFERWTPPADAGRDTGRVVGRAGARGGRRRQPRAVDPPLRPPGRAARSARLAAARRSNAPARSGTASPRTTCRRIPSNLISSPLNAEAVEHAGAGRGVPPRLLLDHRLRLRAGVRARGARSGCARPPRTDGSASRPIRSTRSRCSTG